jgi:hypothetical protein
VDAASGVHVTLGGQGQASGLSPEFISGVLLLSEGRDQAAACLNCISSSALAIETNATDD